MVIKLLALYLVSVFIVIGYVAHRIILEKKMGNENKDNGLLEIIFILFGPITLLFIIGGYLDAGMKVLNDKIFYRKK